MYPRDPARPEMEEMETPQGSGRLPRTHGILASIRIDGTGALRDLRQAVLDTAAAAQLTEQRVLDMALAANEIATNAILHGGGAASVQIWIDERGWHCDVIDDGPGLSDPTAGTRPPGVQEGGFGMWIARRLCDEFEIVPRQSGLHVRLVAHRGHAR